jgi:hypothetical protein
MCVQLSHKKVSLSDARFVQMTKVSVVDSIYIIGIQIHPR